MVTFLNCFGRLSILSVKNFHVLTGSSDIVRTWRNLGWTFSSSLCDVHPLCSQPVGYILEDSNILLRQVNPLLKLLNPIIYGPFICLHVLSTRLVMVGDVVRVFWIFAGHAHKETLCGIYP